jgi:6-methylsalicylate decarboxylase
VALLQKLYYDTALSTSEFVFGALKEFVPTSQVLFGSDFPYIGAAILQAERYGLENSKVWDEAAKAAIDRFINGRAYWTLLCTGRFICTTP